MNIHEYQGKRTFGKVQRGRAARCSARGRRRGRERPETLGGKVTVVRHRFTPADAGRAGGVKIAKSIDEVASMPARSSACR